MSAIRRLQFLPVSLVHFDQCCQITSRFLAANLHWACKPISHILYSYANKIVCHVFIMRHSCMKYRFGWLIGRYTSAMLVAIPVSHLYTSRFRRCPKRNIVLVGQLCVFCRGILVEKIASVMSIGLLICRPVQLIWAYFDFAQNF